MLFGRNTCDRALQTHTRDRGHARSDGHVPADRRRRGELRLSVTRAVSYARRANTVAGAPSAEKPLFFFNQTTSPWPASPCQRPSAKRSPRSGAGTASLRVVVVAAAASSDRSAGRSPPVKRTR